MRANWVVTSGEHIAPTPYMACKTDIFVDVPSARDATNEFVPASCASTDVGVVRIRREGFDAYQ